MNERLRVFSNLLKWDMLLLVRYNILTIALILGVAYFIVVLLFNLPPLLISFIIYSDPAMFGFVFIGVMVLFEKQSDTLSVIKVTPVEPWQYLVSKILTLSVPAIVVGTAVGLAGNVSGMFLMITAVLLSSSMMLLLGFIGVVRVKSFNQYIMVLPVFLAPLSLPLISFFDLYHTPLLWLIPSHSLLIIFKASVVPVPPTELLSGLLVAVATNIGAFCIALQAYRKHVIEA